MNKLIKNYTTEIPAQKSIGEIQELLGKNGASGVALEYNTEGIVTDIFFKINLNNQMLSFRLPADSEKVYNALFANMQGQYNASMKASRLTRASNIAWRICKTWVEAQITLINLEQAKIEQVFLPYLLTGEKTTLYESLQKNNFMLPSGS